MDADRIVDKINKQEVQVLAALQMIQKCEGTAVPNGYRMLFGGTFFNSFATHPNIKLPFTQTDGTLNYSSAAGAYQIIFPTFSRLRTKLKIDGLFPGALFCPKAQDLMARELIAEQNAMGAIKDGDLKTAIDRLSPIWASLPSSKYPQPKRTSEFATVAFISAGGRTA